jgi:hypothetical protein
MLSVYSRLDPPCPSDDINYKCCRCPHLINGVFGSDGAFIRRSAKTRSWEKAEEFKRELESEYAARPNGGLPPHSHPEDQPLPGPAGKVPSNWESLPH